MDTLARGAYFCGADCASAYHGPCDVCDALHGSIALPGGSFVHDTRHPRKAQA
jgi:hypothetical protein